MKRKRTAKEIYMGYGCSTSGRWREGDYDEYKSHGISEEQEREWRKEYQKDLLDLLELEISFRKTEYLEGHLRCWPIAGVRYTISFE